MGCLVLVVGMMAALSELGLLLAMNLPNASRAATYRLENSANQSLSGLPEMVSAPNSPPFSPPCNIN